MKAQRLFLFVLWVVLVNTGACGGARILGIFPTETKSHFAMYGTIMKALAARGHHVTIATHFPEKSPRDNVTELDLSSDEKLLSVNMEYFRKMSYLDNIFDIIRFSLASCEQVLKNPEVLNVIKKKQFDLLVVEIFASDCFLAVGHKMGIPSIGLVSSVPLPWVNDMVALPENTAYTPIYFFPFSQRMNFFSRLVNTLATVYAKVQYEIKSNWRSQELAGRVLGPVPPLRSLAQNFSMILVNSHLSLNQIRPSVPQLVEVGGLHIPRTIPPLPKDLKEFMDSSKDGVVFFSLGTIIPPNSLSDEVVSTLYAALGSLEQNVLWKIDGSLLPPLPPNVRTSTWLPQLSILCHPSTRLFISHGGLLSIQESVHCGVPILGIPMFADQNLNMAELRDRGAALTLRYDDINNETLPHALHELLNVTSYRQNAARISRIFRDRPQHPLDTAIYWVEYVLKFNGARHLRSPAHGLAWYQYLLLDVALFVAIFIYLIVLSVLYISTKFVQLIQMKPKIIVTKYYGGKKVD